MCVSVTLNEYYNLNTVSGARLVRRFLVEFDEREPFDREAGSFNYCVDHISPGEGLLV